MDAAARELKLDPAELRRRNLIRPEQMPYKNPMEQTYDCGEFEKMLDQALALADWNGFAARRAASEQRGLLRGRARLDLPRVDRRQRARPNRSPSTCCPKASSSCGLGDAGDGPGHRDELCAARRRRIRRADRKHPRAAGRHRSRQRLRQRRLALAVHRRRRGERRVAAHRRSCEGRSRPKRSKPPAADIEYREGRFRVVGTDVGIGLFELAARQPDARIRADGSATAGGPSWPNACHVCEVEIDPATGAVEIVAYASVNDIGRVVSPAIVRGQIEGGAMQGIGQALCERVVYDADSGQALTATLHGLRACRAPTCSAASRRSSTPACLA